MHRYSPVRNQRSKGVKIKHVLRICFLIAVCCWLIFQIKRSHCKRKDLKSFNTKILSSTNNIDEVIKLGRKDLQPKEIYMHEEHEIDEEKDDEIDENEQYKFDDEEDAVNEIEEKDGQSQSQSQTAREEHYQADDASSAVTHEHEDQTLNNKFHETGISKHENRAHNGDMIHETGSKLDKNSSDHDENGSDLTNVVEESETSLKSTNMSAVVETEDPDEVQHDAIDSTDFISLEDLDKFDNNEDTVAE